MTAPATTPERLLAALSAAGWVEVGRWPEDQPAYALLRFRGLLSERSLQVPLQPGTPTYPEWMAGTLKALEWTAEVGRAAGRALTEATCPCGGRRWVDDENWQPERWELERGREEGSGLIPCGFCNEGGWDTPVGGGNG